MSNFVTGTWQGNESFFQPAAKILLLCEIPIGMICQETGFKFSYFFFYKGKNTVSKYLATGKMEH